MRILLLWLPDLNIFFVLDLFANERFEVGNEQLLKDIFTFQDFVPESVLYIYSYVIFILGLYHIIMIEFYHLKKVGIHNRYLGDSIIFNSLIGQSIMNREVDKYLIWSVIEPAFFLVLGLALLQFSPLPFTATFIIFSVIAMLIQGQNMRINKRAKTQSWIDTQKTMGDTIESGKGYKDNNEKEIQSKNNNTEEDGATMA